MTVLQLFTCLWLHQDWGDLNCTLSWPSEVGISNWLETTLSLLLVHSGINGSLALRSPFITKSTFFVPSTSDRFIPRLLQHPNWAQPDSLTSSSSRCGPSGLPTSILPNSHDLNARRWWNTVNTKSWKNGDWGRSKLDMWFTTVPLSWWTGKEEQDQNLLKEVSTKFSKFSNLPTERVHSLGSEAVQGFKVLALKELLQQKWGAVWAHLCESCLFWKQRRTGVLQFCKKDLIKSFSTLARSFSRTMDTSMLFKFSRTSPRKSSI